MLILLQECLEYIEQQYNYMKTLDLVTIESQHKYESLHNKITNHILGFLDPSHRQTNIESIEIELKAPKRNVFRSSTQTSEDFSEDEEGNKPLAFNEKQQIKVSTNVHNVNEILHEDTPAKFVSASSALSANCSSINLITSTPENDHHENKCFKEHASVGYTAIQDGNDEEYAKTKFALNAKNNSQKVNSQKHLIEGLHTAAATHQYEKCENRFSNETDFTKTFFEFNKDQLFDCELCKRKFTYKSQLEQHLLKHTGERPFECEICNKKFARKSTLKQHMSIHTGAKPFECENCGRKFAQRGNLKKHKFLRHSD